MSGFFDQGEVGEGEVIADALDQGASSSGFDQLNDIESLSQNKCQ